MTTTGIQPVTTDQPAAAASPRADDTKHEKPVKVRGPWNVAASLLLGLLMVVMFALATVAIVIPKVMGAIPLTVLSSSMEPTFSPGDVVVVQPVDAEQVQVGDVITFQPVSDDPTLVTHRVIGVQVSGGERGFITQGDANSAPDDPIVPGQVKGRVVYSVPLIGHVTNASWGPTAVTVGAVGLILYGVAMVALPDRSGKKKEAE